MMTKVWAVVAAAFSILLVMLKMKSNKVDKLEEENEVLEVKSEIKDKITEVAIHEEIKEDKRKNDFDDSDWRNNI